MIKLGATQRQAKERDSIPQNQEQIKSPLVCTETNLSDRVLLTVPSYKNKDIMILYSIATLYYSLPVITACYGPLFSMPYVSVVAATIANVSFTLIG
jgi:hypothetical protein